MTDIDALRQVAQAVIGPHFGDADDRYYEATKPLVILEMCDELEVLRSQVGQPIDRRQKARHSHEDEVCARWIFGLILNLNAGAKAPNWATWGEEIRKLREIDGRTHKEICELFKWANADEFWCSNVLSPIKLRKHWDRLTLKRNGSGVRTSQANEEAKRRLFGDDDEFGVIDAAR